jgi:3',5'-cyclic AMP phosphodiesterase CpdA
MTGQFGTAKHFCAGGDLQRTSGLEFWRERNDRERRLVVAALARERPAFVVSLGDLVFDGASAAQWGRLDRLLGPLRKGRIAMWPVPGNHEYWGPNARALRNYFARFPHLKGRHHYVLRFGGLALVLTDSNHKDLGKNRWLAQLSWYRRTLRQLDADATVRGILVMQHHPAYTNSTVTGDEAHVKRGLVPPFQAARKTLAMLSGHVHSYERFVRAGKTFIVSGGGGGPRAKLARGSKRRHRDDRYRGPSIRPFHYLCFYPEAQALRIVVRGLRKGGHRFTTLETVRLALSY